MNIYELEKKATPGPLEAHMAERFKKAGGDRE